MSEEIKQKKYQFETKIKLPNMQEILDAASDFTPPSEKKLEVTEKTPEDKKKDIKDLVHKVALTPEQAELQKLGNAVADDAIRRAKEKELKRAEELRRLCREREELAQKKAEEEQKIADEEKRKALQAAREKAQARKDAAAAEAAAAEAAAAAAITADGSQIDSLDDLDQLTAQPSLEKLPPIGGDTKTEPEVTEETAPVQETVQAAEVPSEEPMVDISELAVNPFEQNGMQYKPIKEKEEFKETILEDDYKEEMDLREDTSESVEGDFLDF
ncbi:MAG: hypothetical protein J5653_00600 [Clostridiales bacterium]|nr:hypothetical protein [Clostridiales bacterium]